MQNEIASVQDAAPPLTPRVAPWVFMVLIVPFGLVSGFLSVTLAYQMNEAGISAEVIATLIALSYLPNTWKFFWAPVVDLSWTRKRWYLASTVVTALGLVCMAWASQDQAQLALLTAVVLIVNFTSSLSGMAVDSLMAHSTADDQKGRAAGWFQTGNLGGGALGGGLALWLVQSWGLSITASGWVLAALCGLCCLPLWGLPEPAPEPAGAGGPGQRLWASVKRLAIDLWSVVRSRPGLLAMAVCFLPIGSGAASNLWSVLAGDWHAGANTVALVNGGLGGVTMAAGCLLGGLLCDKMDRKKAYCLYGVLQALLAVAMALAPRTETCFVIFASAYGFALGMAYAGFSGLVLEVIGKGAAATKYNLLASLSNMPIAYVTYIDGLTYERWGAGVMLHIEAVVGVLGLAVFAVVVWLSGRWKRASTLASTLSQRA